MLKLGIVGAGIMGAHHCRIATALPDVEVAVVVDPDPHRGRALADHVGAVYAPTTEALFGTVQAAIVAAPSEHHADIGVELLRGDIDLLVEKPIATTLEDAKRLVAAADERRRILMIGHVERFNPAVAELPRLVDDLIHIDIRRVGPFSPRVDSDVVLDLMIHDLDLVRTLVDADLVRVHALSRRVHSSTQDFAAVLLRFANGVSATLTASQASQTKQRQIELTQRGNVVVADLLHRQVTVHRVEHAEFVDEDGPRYRQNSVIEIPYLDGSGEPLAREQRHFVRCVRERTAPLVSGADGLAALELALRVRDESLREELGV
ncbi:Gfo/Idh/MocA family protein [Actinomadura kijaniata]|uniref:Gfo/Idh/MocA family protein n=1 Tax=Actinomadura kijaniata TaxID=46161 RepID=UPI000AD28985|nr:Gfo/Idh/MocA family oxidoreductase [Actinomadura kijaniata]